MPALGESLIATTFGPKDGGGASVFFPAGTAGSGTPLFLAPGLGLDGRVFEPLSPLHRERRCVFWNLPNELPASGGTAALAALYLAHADLSGMPKRFVFGGASLGGTIAVAAALAAPERCAGLVLSAGSASWRELGWFLRLGPFIHPFIPERGYHRRFARILFGKAGKHPVLDSLRGQALHRTKSHVSRVISLLHEGGPFDLRPRLAEIGAPALLLHAPDDKVVPIRASQTLSRMPNSQLVEVPGGGHLPFLSEPEVCVTAARAFLARIDHAHDAGGAQ